MTTAGWGLECEQCGYDLRTHLYGRRCPECGGSVRSSVRTLRRRRLPLELSAPWALSLAAGGLTVAVAASWLWAANLLQTTARGPGPSHRAVDATMALLCVVGPLGLFVRRPGEPTLHYGCQLAVAVVASVWMGVHVVVRGAGALVASGFDRAALWQAAVAGTALLGMACAVRIALLARGLGWPALAAPAWLAAALLALGWFEGSTATLALPGENTGSTTPFALSLHALLLAHDSGAGASDIAKEWLKFGRVAGVLAVPLLHLSALATAAVALARLRKVD